MIQVHLVLDENDLAVIAAGLGELPLKISKATFDKINAQVAQSQPAEKPPEVRTN